MTVTSAPIPVEAAPVVAGNGTNASRAFDPITIPDDVLYEVVDGKIVEKEIGSRELEIAGLLFETLDVFVQHKPTRSLSGRVRFPHR